MIHSKRHLGCRLQGPGTRGYRRWKTADFSHRAGTGRVQRTVCPLSHGAISHECLQQRNPPPPFCLVFHIPRVPSVANQHAVNTVPERVKPPLHTNPTPTEWEPGEGGGHHDCGSQAHNCTAVQPGLHRDAVAFRTEHEVATIRRAVLLYTAPQTLLLWAPAVTLTPTPPQTTWALWGGGGSYYTTIPMHGTFSESEAWGRMGQAEGNPHRLSHLPSLLSVLHLSHLQGGGVAQGLGGWLCSPVAVPIGLSPLNLLL